MASIRKLCCNDLLAMNHILRGSNSQIASTWQDSDYGSLLYEIMRNPDYALVAVSPSNQILGLITAGIDARDGKIICDITGIFYEDLGYPEIGDMLIQTIVEKAQQRGKVDFVEADVPSNHQGVLNFLGKHGFTLDDKQPEGSTKRFRKDLKKPKKIRGVENSGCSMPPSTGRSSQEIVTAIYKQVRYRSLVRRWGAK